MEKVAVMMSYDEKEQWEWVQYVELNKARCHARGHGYWCFSMGDQRRMFELLNAMDNDRRNKFSAVLSDVDEEAQEFVKMGKRLLECHGVDRLHDFVDVLYDARDENHKW